MTRLLLKAPWFVAAPTVVAIVAVLAIVQNMWLSDYFIRSFVDQADPLAVRAAEATPPLRAAVDATPAGGGAPAAAATQPASAEPGVVAEGTFKDGDPGHNGSGTAKLQRLPDGSLNLRLEGFSVTGGLTSW